MSLPLVVDLDGTLLRSDMLIEAILADLRRGLGNSWNIPNWLIKGKAHLKYQLAINIELPVDILPYNSDVIDFIKKSRDQKRQIVLATATHRIYAEKIADYLGLFDRIIATENDINLSSISKRDRLIEEFGEKGFDYIGNSHDDMVVWDAADKAYLADPDAGVMKIMKARGNVAYIFRTRKNILQTLFNALRPHQWLKNLLLFIPLFAAHQFGDILVILNSLIAFVLFCLTASAGYLINDLLDLESDRYHQRKRQRALASGELPLETGILAIPLLVIISIVLSLLLLPAGFSFSLVLYFIFTVSYSQFLKKIAIVDTIVLAGLYTVRILAGAFACNIVPTFWLLAFSVFLFLSLAMVKRYAELLDLRSKGEKTKTKGRGYYPNDLEIIVSLGTSSGYLSVLVLALYIQDARTITMYKTHELIWLACPILLFWISRIWMLTHRGCMDDDPVLYAVKDRISLITGALFAITFILASLV
jgi:4-hydroxybenzoate polyprenyltransferase